MGNFGNISALVCQCNGMAKRITDTEKSQEIERLLITSFRLLEESGTLRLQADKLEKQSNEFGDKAVEMIVSEGIELDNLLILIKKKVLSDGERTTEE